MRIAVLGATGLAGSAIVAEALRRGHHVTALSRRPRAEADTDRLTTRAVDVADTASLNPVLAEADAAVLTIRPAPGEESRLAPLTRGFLDAAEQHGTRVLVVGGAAPLRSPNDPGRLLIEDPDHVLDAWKTIAQASLDQFNSCREHPYNGWVYLSPPAVLEAGERTGRYRRGTTTLLTDENGVSRIAAPDLAIAVIDELEGPDKDQHFTVAEDATS
ncbi:NAD(P)-dependent oxidoreductase [Streptomyces sp. NPDC004980]